MKQIQSYLFMAVLRTAAIIVGGLALLALLAQGLSRTDLIVENQQSAATYFYVVILGAPQIMALLLPIAMFIATVWTLNRLHRDSEIVVAQAAGMTKWQIASPVLRLACLIALVQLTVNLWVQPTAQREMRETISEARADLAASLVRPGAFTQAADNLTIFVRDREANGVLRGILISDARDPDRATDYIARTGRVEEINAVPNIIMTDGEIQRIDENDSLSRLAFSQYNFELTPFMSEQGDLVLKASDRYLPELFFPDMTNYQERQDAAKNLAEGHNRLASPLVTIVMAMIAISAVLGGDFSRRGYARRIGIAVAGALVVIAIQLSLPANTMGDPALSLLQYAFPIVVFLVLTVRHFRAPGVPRGLRVRSDDDIQTAGAVA